MADQNAELEGLLREPREAPDIEVKEWLDLSSNEHRAALAKEIIALANQGGGFVLIGFAEDDEGQFQPAADRPPSLSAWAQDSVQEIVAKYVEPPFQCRVEHVAHPVTKLVYPIINVPGGHRVPIKAKSGSPDKKGAPDNKKLVANRVYVRRHGPASEEPQTPAEWDELLERCLRNRRTELLAGIRDLLAGAVPTSPTAMTTPADRAAEFRKAAQSRWQKLVSALPPTAAPRFPHGYYEATLSIQGDFDQPSLADFRKVLRFALKNHSGWPPFVAIDRDPFGPRPVDGAIEAWFGLNPDGSVAPPSHSDFWRISPEGLFYTRRGYSEDDRYKGMLPGKNFDLRTTIRRIGEVIVQAGYVATALKAEGANLVSEFHWTGIEGRTLMSLEDPSAFSLTRVCHQAEFSNGGIIAVAAVPDALPEVVFNILKPLYELFAFYHLPKRVVEAELRSLLAHTYAI
jgi:hypothetical protein